MVKQLYDRQETDSALEALRSLSSELPEPFVLIGGWAVYLTVNESFSREHGAPYLGSRDIDVGFHIDPGCDETSLQQCAFARAIMVLNDSGYLPHGSFRFCKTIRRDTGAVLSEEQARAVPTFDVINLFVDMMVDNIHPQHKKIFKVDPLDEPLVARVFLEKCGVDLSIRDVRVMIPPPPILLATKLKSLPTRQPGDKLLKDACDIYAILWHSSMRFGELLSKVRREYPAECKNARSMITREVAVEASIHLGLDVETYLGVVQRL